MVYKLSMSAEKHWKRLKGYKLVSKVVEGTEYKDGIEVEKVA